MGASSGFPIDLVLFGMIAAFLILRLRSILGRRSGFERQAPPYQPPPSSRVAAGPVIEGRPEPVAPEAPYAVPGASSPVGQVLTKMGEIDQSFDPARFLSGVDQAFRMIVAGFAAGDRAALRSLLSDGTYQAFELAISTREAAGDVQVSEIKAMQQLSIEQAELKGRIGSLTVKIVSDQISFTRDASGKPLTGADAVTEITDIWTFERDLSKQDPTWRLVVAHSG